MAGEGKAVEIEKTAGLSPSARVIESPFGIAAGAFSTEVHKSAAESRVSVTPNALNYIVIPQQEHTGYAKLFHFNFKI